MENHQGRSVLAGRCDALALGRDYAPGAHARDVSLVLRLCPREGRQAGKQIHPAHSPGRPQGQQVRWGAGHQELLPLYPHPAADLGAGPENQG